MAYKVLIVDDSSFFQHRLKELVNEHPELEVVGVAANGQEAIDMEEKLRPDIISMDYEMPYMDGVTAVRAIMAKRPVPIVMFSSMTYEGATITLEALDAGAVDFIPKNFAEVSRNSENLKSKFHEKLITFAKNARPHNSLEERKRTDELAADASIRSQRAKETTSALRNRIAERLAKEKDGASTPVASTPAFSAGRKNLKGKLKLLVIGASTGGPVAVSEVITQLPENFPLPIIIIQHMPENFTKAFAERLNRQSALAVKEAETGDKVVKGQVLVAPGGKQLLFDRNGTSVKVIEGDDRVNYKPCVDITFVSAANTFGGSVLAIVMTGMGADGCEGAKILKQKGSFLWGQDQESCVVYGMPAAVAKANLTDEVLPLRQFASRLISDV